MTIYGLYMVMGLRAETKSSSCNSPVKVVPLFPQLFVRLEGRVDPELWAH